MVGTPSPRKGPDLFLELGVTMRDSAESGRVVLLWIGGIRDSPKFQQLSEGVQRFGLSEMVRLIPSVDDPWPLMDLLDVFVLTSREDPFPLACLEAAALGKPVVCFDSGGAKEFVEEDCGIVLHGLDVEAMASAVRLLLSSQELRRRFGEAARRKVRGRHDIAVGAPALYAVLSRTLTSGFEARGVRQ